MQWLWFSVVASVVLTVLLNVAIRLWPGAGRRSAERFETWMRDQAGPPTRTDEPSVRVVVPWKAMLIASLLLTILLNLLFLVFR